jgi:Holliday junction resolvase RusA-like endonuclease
LSKKRRISIYDLPRHIQARIRADFAVCSAKLEHCIKPAAQESDKVEALAERVCIHIHQKRKRLVDVDNVYAKAVVDGLRCSGIIEDDAPKNVESVTFSQEKSVDKEETAITITEV